MIDNLLRSDNQVVVFLNYNIQAVATEGQKANLITDYVLKVKSIYSHFFPDCPKSL